MIKLTLTSEVLKDEIDLKIKELSKNSDKEKRDSNGNDLEWYREMNLKPPAELEEEADVETEIEELLDDDESFTQLESPLYVKEELIDLIIGGHGKENTTIFMTSNKTYSVKESAEQVYKLIQKQIKLNTKVIETIK